MCKPDELKPGAYLKDPQHGKLYECHGRVNNVVHLVDAAGPIDPPSIARWLVPNALKRLELVQPAPCVSDTASVEEFGPLG